MASRNDCTRSSGNREDGSHECTAVVDNSTVRSSESKPRNADQKLLEALRREDFQGPVWARFSEDLARYGYPIVQSWIASLKVFSICFDKGIKCPGPPHRAQKLPDDDASEMANEIIARAINKFRDKVLRPGKWSPEGGASLTTMFITQCIFQFPNVYRRWLNEQGQELAVVESIEGLEFIETRPDADPADLIMIRHEIMHALNHYVTDKRVRIGLILRIMGYNKAECAEMIGTTAKALDSAMQRHQKRCT